MAKAEVLVPIEDIALRAGHAPEGILGWADRLGVEVRRDWADRACVHEGDARTLLDAIHRAGRESAELHRDFEAYCTDWQRRQRDAGEARFQEYVLKALNNQRNAVPSGAYAFVGGLEQLAVPVGAETYSAANGLAAAAREEFARRKPQLTFEAFEKRWRKKR